MKIKQIIQEDFINYKKAAMFIGTAKCGGKCCIEAGIPLSVCQNDALRSSPFIMMADDKIVKSYLENPLTSAIVFGGLEPFDQCDELFNLIALFRTETDDDIVIYTGYRENELTNQIEKLSRFKNIIIKFGRFIPNQKSHFDEVLGVMLVSDNQYAQKIS